MTPLDAAYLLKGFLLAKDAPKPILEAVELLIELSAETRITGRVDSLPVDLAVERQPAKPAVEEQAQDPKPKPAPQVDIDRLITVHKGYAGKREDGTLTDADWPDIKARVARQEEIKAIASDYDVTEEDLGYFIASSQRREGKTSGEAGASPLGRASDAARRP